jgi:aspartyl-tRNA(Asn)/glutamyl-tRNA(Gln) amidotransferase subunit A
LLRAGTDLGPLMGVPVAVKDLFYVDGMPTTAGSRIDVSDVVTSEGPFVQALKRSGCVILGKTWTSEFALGGINFLQRVPWNPLDEHTHRTPGGSSGGSAVALAAELCALAIGSDTGGSVRMPAALCGVFGHKFSSSAFSLDGIFPLSPTLDSIGTFTRSASDSQLVWRTLRQIEPAAEVAVDRLRLAKPKQLFYAELDQGVAASVQSATDLLERAGAHIVPVDVPEIDEFEPIFGRIVPIELIARLGRDRVQENMRAFDPVVQSRFVTAIGEPATDYIAARRQLEELRERVRRKTESFDAWITPATPLAPAPLGQYAQVDAAIAWNRRALRNTRPGNIFDQCGVSIPLPCDSRTLAAGLQIMRPAGHDAQLLAIARAIERVLQRS